MEAAFIVLSIVPQKKQNKKILCEGLYVHAHLQLEIENRRNGSLQKVDCKDAGLRWALPKQHSELNNIVRSMLCVVLKFIISEFVWGEKESL